MDPVDKRYNVTFKAAVAAIPVVIVTLGYYLGGFQPFIRDICSAIVSMPPPVVIPRDAGAR